MFRQKKHDAFKIFLQDVILEGGIAVLTIPTYELGTLSKTAMTCRLDFDDSYQYAVAEIYDLNIVSFDADFDSTPKGRKDPALVIECEK